MFKCKLQCVRCEGQTVRNTRCKRNVCIGTPYCVTHLKKEKHLMIADSEIQGAGKGLFAYDPEDPGGNQIVFKKGQVIVHYDGEIIDNNDLGERYGEWTAPYGLQEKYQGIYYTEDGACRRGIGTLANHKPVSRANARLSFGTGKKRFQIKANANIRNGREIFVSYFGERGGERQYQFNEPTTARTRR